MLFCITHGDDQENEVALVLLGRGLAGHGDCSVHEGGEVGGAVQLDLAQGELVRTKDALHTIEYVVLFMCTLDTACMQHCTTFGGMCALHVRTCVHTLYVRTIHTINKCTQLIMQVYEGACSRYALVQNEHVTHVHSSDFWIILISIQSEAV